MDWSQSRHLYHEAKAFTPGGVHSNARFRSPHPLYFTRAKGSRVWDVDGNEYVDCVVGYGACLLGHGDPDVEAAVIRAVQQGLTNGLEVPLGLSVAQRIVRMFPSAEAVRFANSGTEVLLKALMVARAATGRAKIAKAEGGYHGWADEVLVSVHPSLAACGPPRAPLPVPAGSGLRHNVTETTIPFPYNDLEGTLAQLDPHRRDLAAVVLEPILIECGCVPGQPEYLRGLREYTARHGIVLIFDEVATGFRLAPGGAQALLGIHPDLTLLEKGMGNGYPIAALAGRRDLLDRTDPEHGAVAYFGTLNAGAIPLAAADATLAKLETGEVQGYLSRVGDRIAAGLREKMQAWGIPVQVHTAGGEFHIYFTAEPVIDYRSAARASAEIFSRFFRALLEQGILVGTDYLTSHHGVSFAHSDADLTRILAAAEHALDTLDSKHKR
ncbi:MAG: aspartate aminotransferase family protein [Candidatus Methylomirabilales bacterium]